MALRAHQGDGYRILFEAAHEALRAVAGRTQALRGTELGYFGVLHTWGRDPMVYHPHIHFVVPGGGITLDRDRQPTAWKLTARDFLVRHATLIRVYRGKLRDKLAAAGITDGIPRQQLRKAWAKKAVVDIKPVGDGRAVLKYLAPYVYRVAISDKRIVRVDATHVTYKVVPSGTAKAVTRRVPGTEFVRGFLQHVLPRGFHKVRHYGWLNPRRKVDLEEIRWLACVELGLFFLLRFTRGVEKREEKALTCFHCGGKLTIRRVTFVNCRFLVDACRPYLDSG